MIEVAFYKARYGNRWDRIVAAGTGSPYSHCELVFDSRTGFSASPRDGGVRRKQIDFEDGKWDLLPVMLPDPETDCESRIWQWCLSQEGRQYDWPGVFALGLAGVSASSGVPCDIPAWWFCSEFCTAALQQGGLFPSLQPKFVTPHALSYAMLAWNDCMRRKENR
jgi:hypothetical protein